MTHGLKPPVFELDSRRLVVTLAVCLAGLGCGKLRGFTASGSASAAPSAMAAEVWPGHGIAGVALSSPTAFELAARSDGLQLVWASDEARPGWLSELSFTQAGKPGPAHKLPLPARSLGRVTDLGASYAAEQLALAWLEQGDREARAQAALFDAAGTPALLDLGPAALVAAAARGNIAIAAEPERARALVMWRGLEAPCVAAHSGPCTGFSFRRVQADQAEPTGLPLSVPVPCASHSVELATAAGRFHYGVCTREGSEPVTTMFSIQYDPEYARAEPLLKGCLPLGTIDVNGRAWLVGDCHGKRRAAAVPLMDERVEVESIDALSISCTPQRAELQQGRFRLTLSAPRAGLQAILPPSLAPTGARVGWTGTTLVAVYANGSGLETRSHSCRGGKLEPAP